MIYFKELDEEHWIPMEMIEKQVSVDQVSEEYEYDRFVNFIQTEKCLE